MRRARARERASALQELGLAIESRQFELYYQPQVRADTGRVEGFEALLRLAVVVRGADTGNPELAPEAATPAMHLPGTY